MILGLYSCKSAKKLYEQGDYYQAVIKSVNKLRKNPDHKKSKEALVYAYPLAVEMLLNDIERQKGANPRFQYTAAVASYDKLNRMYDNINRAPGARKVIPNPTSFYEEIGVAKSKAAEEQYQAGVEQLNTGRRENAKRAYSYFQMSNRYVNNYKDVLQKIDEAHFAATLKVLVDSRSVGSTTYALSADFFYDQVDKILREIERNEFIRFFSLEEAKRVGIQRPSQILTLNFLDFVVGETHTTKRIEKMSRDSVKVGVFEVKKDSVVDVMGEVTAKVTINHVEVISRGLLHLLIQDDYSTQALLDNRLSGEFVWFHEWGNFNGDIRALTDAQVLATKNEAMLPPPPQELFIEFTVPIHQQVRNRLINFYKGY